MQDLVTRPTVGALFSSQAVTSTGTCTVVVCMYDSIMPHCYVVWGLVETFVLGGTLMFGYGAAIVSKTIRAVTESPVTTSSTPIPIFVVKLFDLSSAGRHLMFPRRNQPCCWIHCVCHSVSVKP